MPKKKKKNNQPYQHEPLVPPMSWYGEERRFAIRIEQLMDDLYNKYSALSRRVAELEAKDDAQV